MRTARGTSSPGGCTRTFAGARSRPALSMTINTWPTPAPTSWIRALPLVAGPADAGGPGVVRRLRRQFARPRWGRTLIQRTERARAQAAATAPRSMSEIDLLLGVRDDLREGSLRFRRGGQGSFLAAEASGIPVLTDLPALLDIAARAERDAADYEDLKRLLQAGSSLGGARPKAHVLDSDGRIAIAKFPSESSDTWNVMAWEKVALDLARDAEMAVPDSTLLRAGDRHVLVVDRAPPSRRDPGWIRQRDDDARSQPRTGAVISAATEIAQVIEERSPSATAELRQLWRRMAFTILISNTDDHLRNHGFLHERGESWILSPAFDLNPSPSPGPGPGLGPEAIEHPDRLRQHARGA